MAAALDELLSEGAALTRILLGSGGRRRSRGRAPSGSGRFPDWEDGDAGSSSERAACSSPTARIRRVRYHLTTFGCQMNDHDSERMKGLLESLG